MESLKNTVNYNIFEDSYICDCIVVIFSYRLEMYSFYEVKENIE